MPVHHWKIPAAASDERLDRHVASRLDVPRNQVQAWIRAGRVTVDGKPAKASWPVAVDEKIRCDAPAARTETRIAPEPGELQVLYADADMVVLDKPAGIAVHPGAGRPTGTIVHFLLARYPEIATVGGPGRPGIVHRLDIGTSGLLVVARSEAGYRGLSSAFSARTIEKRYLCCGFGVHDEDSGSIESPIGRHPGRRKEMAVRPDGRPARTEYRRLAAVAGVSLFEVTLVTGRTHQIRVHMKSIKHPLVGDPVYGEARWKGCPRQVQALLRSFPRPALHAWRLSLHHPVSARALAFEAPPPSDLRRLWDRLGGEPLSSIIPSLDRPPG